MDKEAVHTKLVIANSPIEFVVVGPKGPRDGVLVQSDNAKLDLIGLAADQSTKERRNHSQGLMRMLLGPSRFINSVWSFPLDRRVEKWDTRKAKYRFCWAGLASSLDKEQIDKTFDRYVADLQSGIEREDIEQIEWSLAPIILECTERDARRKAFRRFVLMYLCTLIAVFIIFFLIYLPIIRP